MKLEFIFLLLLPLMAIGQTHIDRLISKLDSLKTFTLSGWKYSTDFRNYPIEAISRADFDDSAWQPLAFNQYLYVDSCWIRTEFQLPEKMVGQPVSGAVHLLVSVDDYGYLWVNGENKGHFPWDGDFAITSDARPGIKFVLVIKAINTGGPLRLLRAQLEMADFRELSREIDNFILSLRIGQKLLGVDTYQSNARVKVDPGIDKSRTDAAEKKKLMAHLQNLAPEIDIVTLESGNIGKFRESIRKIKPRLKPVDDFVKQYTLFFASNAHIDAAWLWRYMETQEVCKNTFASVINIMNRHPDFTYTQSAACYYDWMQTMYPELFRQIKERIADGRWEIVGGMWIEPDCNLPDGTSWMRQLLYAQRYFQKNFGKMAKIGWNPDSFGYNWNMPQFYRNAGIDVFITQKIGWNDTNVFPHRVFWWEAPDNSRILSYFPFDYVNTIENPFQLVDWLRQFDANTGFTKMMILFGVGDHGGGPTMEMLERIERLKSLDVFPTIEYGTAEQYLEWLKKQNLSEVPVWKDELYLEYHRGTLTTQAKMKEYNRQGEVLLTNTEKFATLAGLSGFKYPKEELEQSWRKILFNQFHDILPGSSIREVHLDAAETYREAFELADFQLDGALKTITENINTSRINGKPVVVFNSLSWERSGIVHLPLPKGDAANYTIFDGEGKEIPSQILSVAPYQREMIFIAGQIPALGYAVFELRSGPAKKIENDLRITPAGLENEFFKIVMNEETGWITSIVNKKSREELLNGPGNELQLFDDRPSAWDAWNIGLGERYPSTFRRLEIVEDGPVRVVLRVYHDFLKPGVIKSYPTEYFPSSFFERDIILYSRTPRIDFRTEVDWWEDHVMLKVAFPFNLEEERATFEIPYGTIERPTRRVKQEDKGKWEVAALRWADLSNDQKGISLLNRSKYGHDVNGNVLRLSLLRSPEWPDPTADRGKHTIDYALYPHSGTWKEAGTVMQGYEFNYPLLAVLAKTASGKMPLRHSFIRLQPRNLVLTSVKQSETDPNAWVLQWYETTGKQTKATLTLPENPASVVKSDFLERELESVNSEGNTVELITEPYKIKTIIVKF